MIPNEQKEGWHYLAVKSYLHYYEDKNCLVFILLKQKINLNRMKKYV